MNQELALALSRWVEYAPNEDEKACRRVPANIAAHAEELLVACQEAKWCLPASVQEVMAKCSLQD